MDRGLLLVMAGFGALGVVMMLLNDASAHDVKTGIGEGVIALALGVAVIWGVMQFRR